MGLVKSHSDNYGCQQQGLRSLYRVPDDSGFPVQNLVTGIVQSESVCSSVSPEGVMTEVMTFCFSLQWKGVHILLDNSTTVAYLNKQVVTQSRDLCGLTAIIRKTLLNGECRLDPKIFSQITKRSGQSGTDLFASNQNHQVKKCLLPVLEIRF